MLRMRYAKKIGKSAKIIHSHDENRHVTMSHGEKAACHHDDD